MIFLSLPGIVCAGANNRDEFCRNLLSSKSYLSPLFNKKDFLVGRVDVDECIYTKGLKQHFKTRTNAILFQAIMQIEHDIKSVVNKFGSHRVGVVLGCTTTGIEENFAAFNQYANSGFFDKNLFYKQRNSLCNPAEFVADMFHLKSVNFAISTACTSGLKAMIKGFELINANVCDAVICGGVDSLSSLTLHGFSSLDILSKKNANPFSKNRDGINIGEGAAVFVMSKEALSNTIILGFASNNDAFHITRPREDAKFQKNALNQAIHASRIKCDDVGYINLHGTGTIANDSMEANLFSNDFSNTPCSSIKSIIGHTLGAAGAIESAVCVSVVNSELNYLPMHVFDGEFDNSLPKINLVDKLIKNNVKVAINASFAFGGDNVIMIFGNADERN